MATPNSSAAFSAAYADLGWPADTATPPVVYSEAYNIHFFGLERFHPFDASKFRKIVTALKSQGSVTQTIPAREVTKETLLDVHTPDYLNALHQTSRRCAQVFELPWLRFIPSPLIDWLLLRKMRTHVGGTMLAVGLAAQRGWAVNLGGGMHHASYSAGSGWCPYSDITLAVRRVRAASGGAVQRVMVIDTDAHQGNGYARDKLHTDDQDLFIVDLYNAAAFPQDKAAQEGIDVDMPLWSGCQDEAYLDALETALGRAFASFQPDLVIHNAGTDILAGDPLGGLSVSVEAVIERDSTVWQRCREAGIPICMLLSGGYAANSGTTVTASLANLLASEQQCSTGAEETRPASAL